MCCFAEREKWFPIFQLPGELSIRFRVHPLPPQRRWHEIARMAREALVCQRGHRCVIYTNIMQLGFGFFFAVLCSREKLRTCAQKSIRRRGDKCWFVFNMIFICFRPFNSCYCVNFTDQLYCPTICDFTRTPFSLENFFSPINLYGL